MTTILGSLLAGGTALYYAVPKVAPKVKEMFGGNVEPHDAVALLIKYFKKLNCTKGVTAAKECGKLIYDALGESNEQK